MNKYQKRIIELLDKEGLMDKELKRWCVLYCWHDLEEEEIWNIIYDSDITIHSEKRLSKDSWKESMDYEIIWQYHLGSILQWFYKNCNRYEITNSIIDLVLFLDQSIELELDIIKPPMERTEEQNKELVEFMEKIIT